MSFRIIILAWKRPESLQRLIRSLDRSDYGFKQNNPNWETKVEIRVDGEGGEDGEKVKKIANNWQCLFATKVYSMSSVGFVL